MPMQAENNDVQQAPQAVPCAVCGKHSGCESWGFPLCYGKTGERIGCVTRLWEVMPFENEKAFTVQWIAEQKKKARAA